MPQDSLSQFWQGHNVAIVGLSPDSSKPSYEVGEYLKNAGYTLYPVYPRGEKILGFSVCHSLQELPCVADVLVIFRKSEAVESVVREALALRCARRIWVQLGISSAPARAACEQAGVPYIENHCIAREHERIERQTNVHGGRA